MIKKLKPAFLIALIGFLVRVLFTVFFAKYYFGREDIFVDGDTSLWTTMFTNWLETGTLTLDSTHEYGYFGRTPGYTFFIGLFYLISGLKWLIAFKIIAWVQIIIDSIAVYVVYKTSCILFKDSFISLIAALLYAFYPFIIVWNPVVYSEALSVSSLIVGIFFLVRNNKYDSIFAAAIISFSILCRPQVLPIILVISLFFLIQIIQRKQSFFKKAFLFFITFMIVYGSWPLRNYINYNKVVLTQDIRSFKTAGEDWLAFTEYIYSVKAEWEPQFTNIITNQPVQFPKIAYINTEDSLKLERAIYLAKNCGSSFSNWKGYWKEPFTVTDSNCNQEIAILFHELKKSQIKTNPLNYYLLVPLQNLKKALFKLTLNNPSSTLVKVISTVLFSYRSLLLLLGIFGAFLMIKQNNLRPYGLIILGYFLLLYFMLCFGTGAQFRNIEMRYFLQADVLMLFPAAFLISELKDRFLNKKV